MLWNEIEFSTLTKLVKRTVPVPLFKKAGYCRQLGQARHPALHLDFALLVFPDNAGLAMIFFHLAKRGNLVGRRHYLDRLRHAGRTERGDRNPAHLQTDLFIIDAVHHAGHEEKAVPA